MGRWEPDARGRLERAALELYAEHGFDQTTVADIAARAGLTERTFFRHFADKREVLFRGDELAQSITAALAQVPGTVGPLDAVAAALESTREFFAERRPYARQRQQVITANPALQERELIKLSSMAGLIGAALRDRGVGEPAASLTAEAGVAVFRVAFERWLAERRDRGLDHHIREALAELRALAAG
jgi:AcrR family transcriptional regulator